MKFLYIILALFLFGILIFVHELGHYIAARISGVRVIEFAIGMGPKLIKWKSKKTKIKYSVRLLPIGGFCAMEGEGENDNPTADPDDESGATDADGVDEVPEDMPKDDSRSFKKKPAWVRIIILAAGPLMNILVGFIMSFVMILLIRDANGIILSSNTVAGFDAEQSVSDDTGLQIGDKIIKVGNVPIYTAHELAYEIGIQGKTTEKYYNAATEKNIEVVSLDITVLRDGETVRLEKVKFPAGVSEGVIMGMADFYPAREPATLGAVIKHACLRPLSMVKMVWDSLIGLVTGRFSVEALSGPVGTTEIITEAASAGWQTLLYIFIVIAINLGVFNLFPILPLDGGHIVFALIELIIRRPVPKKVEDILQTVGVAAMFGLMIAVTIKDVIKLF